MTRSRFLSLLVLPAVVVLAACATSPAITPAATSKSGFDGAVYKGTETVIATARPGNTEYRVFRQGATGFVSIGSVRSDAEQAASEFCERKTGGTFNALRERVSPRLQIMGNFPRVEIVFECVPKPAPNTATAAPTANKFQRLEELKGLLDNGTLTREEFEREKAKILTEP